LSRPLLLIGVAVFLLFAAFGCGDDSDEEQSVTTSQTETVTPTDIAGAAPLHDCPDASAAGVGLTDIRTNLACTEATGIADEVVSQDDCVEETPSGTNTCRVEEFDCEVENQEPVAGGPLDISCEAGPRHIEFQQQTTPTGGTETGPQR
jgi:hypothetical protein